MPLYSYSCDKGHSTEALRPMAARHDPLDCTECKGAMSLRIALTHRSPDGIYSYAPNIGNADTFDRKWEASKAKKLIEK